MAEEYNRHLAHLSSGPLKARQEETPSIGSLENFLLSRFPSCDAEEWDKMGLMVGRRAEQVSGVCIALDPTREAIAQTAAWGANVLLTHHPVFLDPPDEISPGNNGACIDGAVVWDAVTKEVALLNVHTALDASPLAQHLLPSMLNLCFDSVLLPHKEDATKGYGQLCTPTDNDRSMNLSRLAARCLSVFGRTPRVWGDPMRPIAKVVTATGSASNLVDCCIKQEVDCLVCGELRYHTALDASMQGLAIIELGHDVSEIPLCAILAQSAHAAGVPEHRIAVLDQTQNWWTPEAVRR